MLRDSFFKRKGWGERGRTRERQKGRKGGRKKSFKIEVFSIIRNPSRTMDQGFTLLHL